MNIWFCLPFSCEANRPCMMRRRSSLEPYDIDNEPTQVGLVAQVYARTQKRTGIFFREWKDQSIATEKWLPTASATSESNYSCLPIAKPTELFKHERHIIKKMSCLLHFAEFERVPRRRGGNQQWTHPATGFETDSVYSPKSSVSVTSLSST